MDIKYNFHGVMEVALDEADISALQNYGRAMCRNGLKGYESKTHVLVEKSKASSATLDGDADVIISLPAGSVIKLPIDFHCSDITAFGEDVSGRLRHYFGEKGGIRLLASVTELTTP